LSRLGGDQHAGARLVPALILLGLLGTASLFWWVHIGGVASSPRRAPTLAASQSRPVLGAAEFHAHLADPAWVLTRRDLVMFVRLYGSTPSDRNFKSQNALVGRRFSVQVPLGCGDTLSARSTASARWRYDKENGVIQMEVLPEIWPKANLRVGSAVSVFWISRPHHNADECPPAVGEPAGNVAKSASPRVGLAAVTDRPETEGLPSGWGWYSSTLSASATKLAIIGPKLRLQLEGTVSQAGTAGVTLCNRNIESDSLDCAVASRIDRVAFVDPASHRVLAQWPPV
jgi:hypothetical protein